MSSFGAPNYYSCLSFPFLHTVTACGVKLASSCWAIHMPPASPNVCGVTLPGDPRRKGPLYQKALTAPAFQKWWEGRQQYKSEAQWTFRLQHLPGRKLHAVLMFFQVQKHLMLAIVGMWYVPLFSHLRIISEGKCCPDHVKLCVKKQQFLSCCASEAICLSLHLSREYLCSLPFNGAKNCWDCEHYMLLKTLTRTDWLSQGRK